MKMERHWPRKSKKSSITIPPQLTNYFPNIVYQSATWMNSGLRLRKLEVCQGLPKKSLKTMKKVAFSIVKKASTFTGLESACLTMLGGSISNCTSGIETWTTLSTMQSQLQTLKKRMRCSVRRLTSVSWQLMSLLKKQYLMWRCWQSCTPYQ